MTRVYLVASQHDDVIGGPGNLRQLYDKLKPSIIVTESSQRYYDELRILSNHLECMLRGAKVDPSRLAGIVERFNLFAYGFPVSFNQQYAQEKGLEHHFISVYLPINAQSYFDLAGVVGGIIHNAQSNNGVISEGLVEELMKEERPISKEELEQSWKRYLKREGGIRHELQLMRLRRAGLLGESDQLMEDRIRSLHHDGAVIVFPVGMFHATDSLLNITLHSRIKDLTPERILLI